MTDKNGKGENWRERKETKFSVSHITVAVDKFLGACAESSVFV